jgi:hypothetical protein
MSKRKMLAAEEDLANKVVELANRRGQTVYQTVNDIIQQALRAEESGLNLKEAVDRQNTLEKAKQMGLTFTVEHLYFQVIDSAYSESKEKIKDLWRDIGFWYGKYFQSRDKDPVASLKEALELLSFGTSEFRLEKGRNEEISITCIGEKFTKGFTEVYAIFIEAAFSVLGYKLEGKELSRGIIKLKLEKSR